MATGDGASTARRMRLSVVCAWALAAAGAAGCTPAVEFVGQRGTPDGGTPSPLRPSPIPPEWNCGPTCYRDPAVAASPDPAARLSGPADGNDANRPAVVYPLADSLHPVNLSDITVQWQRGPGGGQQLFRIRVTPAPATLPPFDFYVGCQVPPPADPLRPTPEECVYTMPAGAWLDVAARNRGAEVALTVAAVDDSPAGAGAVAISDAQRIRFSLDPVEGGLYYWSTSLRGTYRLLFGARKAQPFISPMTASNPFGCGGCHVVSRDGSTIAFSEGDTAFDAVLRVAGTADPELPLFPAATAHDSATIALNPTGSRVLVSSGERLILRATAEGRTLTEVDPALLTVGGVAYRAFHPEWSPDGREIAVTLSTDPDSEWAVRTGAIGVIPVAGDAFGPAQIVVPLGDDLSFYPSWSPDGKWIVFASAPAGQGLISYNQRQARLRLVPRAGGPIRELARATQGLGNTSTWPKFAPYAQVGGNVLFITFNSKMDYGFLLRNRLDPSGGRPQLWLAAIDLGRLAQDPDPSFAPMWLPFQEIDQNNHLGFWTQGVGCRLDAQGASIGCGDGEFCKAGLCQWVVP